MVINLHIIFILYSTIPDTFILFYFIFTVKDKIKTCIPSLMDSAKQYVELVNRIKSSEIPGIQSLLDKEPDNSLKKIVEENSSKPIITKSLKSSSSRSKTNSYIIEV